MTAIPAETIHAGIGADTVVPTPGGFVPTSDLSIGDGVFGSDGHPTVITGISDHGIRPTVDVSFADGARALATTEQLWLALDGATGNEGYYRSCDIAANLALPDGTARWSIRLTEPVAFLPVGPTAVDPMTFGEELRSGLVESEAELVPYLINGIDVRRDVLAGMLGGKAALPASASVLATAAFASLVRSLGGIPEFERAGFGHRIVPRHGGRRYITAVASAGEVSERAVTVAAADGQFLTGGDYVLCCGGWGRP